MKSVSAYNLACGCVQREENFSLSREHSVYHVKGFDNQEKHVWKSFDTLAEARKELKKLVKENKKTLEVIK